MGQATMTSPEELLDFTREKVARVAAGAAGALGIATDQHSADAIY